MSTRERVADLRDDVAALALAMRDPRTPWYATLIAGLTVGLALSPIDPVPDFVPVLGYADDFVFIPAGAYLTWRLTPDAVIEDARERAADAEAGRVRWIVAGIVVLAWLVVGIIAVRLLLALV